MVHAVLAVIVLQQPIDSAYTAKIRELTTEARFNTELTDHLPADARVPTPLKALGYVPGTVGRLSYVADYHDLHARPRGRVAARQNVRDRHERRRAPHDRRRDRGLGHDHRA